MAEGHVDVKRYQIISLLYIVFICFSVINIKMSVLDSNIWTIKSFQSLTKEEEKKVVIGNQVVQDNIDTLNTLPKAQSYLRIRSRLAKSYQVVDGVLKHVDEEFVKNKTTLLKQFNSRTLIEKILASPQGVGLIEKDLFELSDFIKKSPYKLDIKTSLDSIVPIMHQVTSIKGKVDEWEYYMFEHKPSAISYMQLERIKLLITKQQLLYQEAALAEIGYQPTYFSKGNPKLYILKELVKEYKPEQILEDDEKAVYKTDEIFDELFKSIINSLHTENIFIGLNTTFITDFNFEIDKDFTFEVVPKTKITQVGKDFKVTFSKTGEYLLKFYDLRKNEKKLLFDKKIVVNPLPDPLVRVKGDNLNTYSISVKDLLASERLEATLEINNLNYFPGRINSYKVVKIRNGREEETANNYGELFQSTTQKILGGLRKNDLVIFDNINMSLIDGSTRTSPPIVYKITD